MTWVRPVALYFTLSHPCLPNTGVAVERIAAGGRQVAELTAALHRAMPIKPRLRKPQ